MADIPRPETGRATPAGVTDIAAVAVAGDGSSYVEWGAVFAGVVAALAVSFVLLTFGSAVGLSAVSPWTSGRGTATALSIGAGFWLILVNVWAFALAGYLAGRMRHRRGDSAGSETAFRDGAHGVTAWAMAVTVGAVVGALAASSIARGALDAGAAAARNISTDPVSAATDTLLRTSNPAPNAPVTDVRSEISGILARSTTQGEVSAADRTYLAQLVSARTGLPQAEAEKRVNDTIVTMKQVADKARKTAVVIGFITAASLLLGAAAAWWGGTTGGRHRDEGTIWGGLGSHAHASSYARPRVTH